MLKSLNTFMATDARLERHRSSHRVQLHDLLLSGTVSLCLCCFWLLPRLSVGSHVFLFVNLPVSVNLGFMHLNVAVCPALSLCLF